MGSDLVEATEGPEESNVVVPTLLGPDVEKCEEVVDPAREWPTALELRREEVLTKKTEKLDGAGAPPMEELPAGLIDAGVEPGAIGRANSRGAEHTADVGTAACWSSCGSEFCESGIAGRGRAS